MADGGGVLVGSAGDDRTVRLWTPPREDDLGEGDLGVTDGRAAAVSEIAGSLRPLLPRYYIATMSAAEPMNPPKHVRVNRDHWDESAHDWVAMGERAWALTDPTWGTWGVPEVELEMMPTDMTGLDAIELGCGTGYVSAWMARRGAAVTGIDNSSAQLATARRLMVEHGIEFALIHGDAERVPVADESFDFAINEYGAAIWCDPEVWVREAHRILRPGGRLVFLANHPMAITCAPVNGDIVGVRLVRPYFGLHTLDWRDVEIDPGGVNFCLPISGWVELFHRVGFTIEDLHEPRAPEAALGVEFFVQAEWAKRWPSELVWKVARV